MLLRFDYQSHVDQHPECDASIGLEVITSVNPSGLGDGIVIPRAAPCTFARRYYHAGVGTGFLSLLTSFIYAAVGPEILIPRIVFLGMVVLSWQFSMVCTTLVLAHYKGQLSQLWHYTENWKVEEVQLPSNSNTKASFGAFAIGEDEKTDRSESIV